MVILSDSEWAFALFISKLPDPTAKTFTPNVLQKAMEDTIAALNVYRKEFDITSEVCPEVSAFERVLIARFSPIS